MAKLYNMDPPTQTVEETLKGKTWDQQVEWARGVMADMHGVPDRFITKAREIIKKESERIAGAALEVEAPKEAPPRSPVLRGTEPRTAEQLMRCEAVSRATEVLTYADDNFPKMSNEGKAVAIIELANLLYLYMKLGVNEK